MQVHSTYRVSGVGRKGWKWGIWNESRLGYCGLMAERLFLAPMGYGKGAEMTYICWDCW